MTSADALMFPGQGTQRIGMARWIERASPAAAAVFDVAGEVLGRDVRRLCFAGPAKDLTATANAQVAVFTAGAAAAAYLAEQGVRPTVVLGHSVGELTALVAAGALDLADGLRLVAARGELMGRIAAGGTMTSVVGLDPAAVAEACRRAAERTGEPVVPALLNTPDQVVVSGTVPAVEAAERLVLAAGARAVTRLRVSDAFHSPLMERAVPDWRPLVAAVPLKPPAVPVALNTVGRLSDDVDEIRRALVDGLTGAVRWVGCLRAAAAECSRLVEAGDSKVLAAFARVVLPGVPVVSLHDPRAARALREDPAGPESARSVSTRTLAVPDAGRLVDLLEGLPASTLFSAGERRLCAERAGLSGWAGRLAAKLAVADVLGRPRRPLGEAAADLARIEIRPTAPGPCDSWACAGPHGPQVYLGGRLLPGVEVSISHTRTFAVAIAVRDDEEAVIAS